MNRTQAPRKLVSEAQQINDSWDESFSMPMTEPVGYDGQNLQRLNADNMAMKVTEVGSVTYLAIAAPGTPQSEAYWQVKKIDKTTGVVITWADGDANYDNVATDLTSLTYS